jgi:hypothetical protein
MMTVDPILILVGGVAFALHFLGKWQSTTEKFIPWITTKANVTYFATSVLFCALAILLQPELSEVLGMKPLTYAATMCYGGGHFVARFLEVKQAVEIKKAEQ